MATLTPFPNRNLYINSDIDKDSFTDISKSIDILIQNDNEINKRNINSIHEIYPNISADEISNNIPDINIHINSPGGYVYHGLGIYDKIKSLQSHCNVNIFGSGLIASCGVLIFLAGNRSNRKCTKNTTFLIHQVSGLMFGTVKEIEDNTIEYKRLNDVIFNIIVKETNITIEQLKDIYEKKKDWIITAEDALKLGIVTEII